MSNDSVDQVVGRERPFHVSKWIEPIQQSHSATHSQPTHESKQSQEGGEGDAYVGETICAQILGGFGLDEQDQQDKHRDEQGADEKT